MLLPLRVGPGREGMVRQSGVMVLAARGQSGRGVQTVLPYRFRYRWRDAVRCVYLPWKLEVRRGGVLGVRVIVVVRLASVAREVFGGESSELNK